MSAGDALVLEFISPVSFATFVGVDLTVILDATALPDLVVDSVMADPTVVAGEQVAVEWTVRNTGDIAATGIWVDRVFLSIDDFLDGDDIQVGEFPHVGPLAGGTTYTVPESVAVPIELEGDYYVIVLTDANDDVDEGDGEDNNYGVSSTPTTVTRPPAPDLQVTDIATPCAGAQGQPFEVTWTVTNDGTDVALAPWTDQLLLSDDPAIGDDTPLLPTFSFTDDLAIGESYTRTEMVTLPEGAFGEHWTVVVTDVDEDVDEDVNEANNSAVDDESFYVHSPEVVSLCAWYDVDYQGGGAGNWVLAPDSLSVVQTINGEPTFLVSDFDLSGSQFQGSFGVQSGEWDDDFIGFAFGFLGLGGSEVDEGYYLFTWKKGDQSGAEAGFKLLKIIGPSPDLWDGEPTSGQIVQLARHTGSSLGWQYGVEYDFFLTYQSNGNIRVIIRRASDGQELWNTGLLNDPDPLGPGKIGFYNYSQENVTYAGFTQAELLPPVAVADGPYTLDASMADITLDATGSYDPDGALGGFDDIVSLQWDLGNDGIEDDEGRTDPHQVISPEDVLAKGLALGVDVPLGLTVVDADGLEGSDKGFIEYSNSPPTADAQGPYGPVYPGASAPLQGVVDDPDLAHDIGESLVVEWDVTAAKQAVDIGDGFADQAVVDVPYETLLPLHRDYGETFYLNVADASGSVASSATTIDLALPDLEATDVTTPTEGMTGETFELTWRVTNIGEAMTINSWVDRIYFSLDDQPGGDELQEEVSFDDQLEAGAYLDRDLPLVFPMTPGVYWIVVMVDAADSVYENYEDNNIIVSDLITVNGPNLIISDAGAPEEGCTGQQVDVTWTVTNEGAAPATGMWPDCVYLSADDQIGDDTQLGCVDRPYELNQGEFYDGLATVTIPGVEEGDYWIIIRVDDGDAVPEYDEIDNDAIVGPFTISRPNLTISDELDPMPTEGWTGWPIAVGWTVTNTSACPAEGSWQDCVYLSYDNEIGGDVLIGCMPNPVGLEVGEGYDRVGTFTIPAVPEDDYWIVVKVNDGCVFAETDCTGNDTIDGPFLVYELPCADLEPSELVIPSDPVAAGDDAHVDWVVTNVGNGATSTPFWYDRIYLSEDNEPGNDILIERDFQNPMALNPGEALAQNVQFTVPAALVGSYYVIVEIDARNDLAECLEDNNIIVSDSTLQIEPRIPPILTMTNCEVDPPGPWPGDSITVTWTIKNTGETPTGPFTIDHAIVFSEDDVLDATGDEVLAWHVGDYSGDLDVDETSEPINASVNVPLDVFGDHYIIVWPDPPLWVDLDRSPCEVPITVQTGFAADLEVDEVAAPASGSSGQPVGITWTVRNAANEPTHVSWWDDKVYLSVDDDFDTTEDNTLIGTFRHNGILDFDESYTGPEAGEVILPDDTEGVYYIFVHADAGDGVYEGASEENNVGITGPIEIFYEPPDLQVESVAIWDDGAPALSVLSGTVVTVEWVVSNIGGGETSADSWSDRIYISTDGMLDIGTDPVLATVPHSGTLGPSESYTASRDVTIPIELFGDAVYVFVCTDYADDVYEFDNGDNCDAGDPVEVIWAPPDLVVESVVVATDGDPVLSGSAVTVEWTVINDYLGATTADSWSDCIYISTDDTLDGAYLLTTASHSGALDPDESYPASTSVEIPIDFVGPEIYILVETDCNDAVYELDDDNASSSDPIEVVWGLPDLIVETISAPGGAVAGEPLDVSWTVRDVGGPTAAGTWNDRVYLSADRWLSGDDIVFDTVAHTGDMDYDAIYTANATIDLPPDLADEFYLIVETDTDDAVAESDEDINTHYVAISLTPLPVDLQITDVDAPETALSGQSMQLAWSVTNFGTGATPTGFWRDAVYLSPDQYLDSDADYYLGYFDHSGILNPAGEPGDTYTRAEWVDIPNDLSGPYYVFLVTDTNDHVFEENDSGDAEENNVGYDGIAVQLEIPPPADLVVISIDVPPSGTLGEEVTIQWTVRNDGAFEAQGSWQDSVYISDDTIWDIGDKKIGKVQHSGPLAPDAEYSEPESLTAPVPGVVPGDYYIIVRTDIHNEVRESLDGEENNITASMSLINVDCWVLALGESDSSHELSTGTEHYFRIPDVPEGEDVLVWLDCYNDSASTELYIRYAAVPDRGHYDFAYLTPFTADHELAIPSTRAGDYYVLVYGDSVPGGPSGYTVGDRLLEFEIRRITPDHGGNVGSVTALIEGGRLSPDTVARLVAGETVIEGTTWVETTPIQMFVTFDLNGAPAGVYDVEIEKPDEAPVALPKVFEVVEGSGPSLDVHLVAPSALRGNTPYIIYIEYGNNGSADLAAPLFSVSAPQGVPLRLDPAEDAWPAPVQVMGISMEGPPGLLRPGTWQHIPVYSQSPGNPGEFEISLGMMVADTTPVDWEEIEADLRPADIPDELWAALWANLITAIGSTWADFQAAMSDSATFLAGAGQRTYDARELFAVAVKNAGGDLTPRFPLAVRVDAFSPAPGLQLAFLPVALNTLGQRFRVGPLGRGWSHNFEYSLFRLDEDTVYVSSPGGFVRPFTRLPDGSWQGVPGNFGVLEDLGGDTYQITEKDGLVWLFGPSGQLAYVEETNGNRITLSYSGELLVAVSHSNGQQLTLEYNAEGRIRWLTDHVGRQTEYLYDVATVEHLIQVIAPGNRQTLYDYNPATGSPAGHALSSVTFPDQTHRSYSYDDKGRVAEASRDGGVQRFTLTYDNVGTVRLSDAYGNVSTLWLGPNAELLSVQDALGSTLHVGYDQDLNLTRLTAPDGAEYEFDYDNLGNLTESIDPLDGVISLIHTGDPSRLDWLSDSKGNLMDFDSDAQGNLAEIIYPDTSSELFGYDDRGTIVAAQNARGRTIIYGHDSAGRLTQKIWLNSDGQTFERTFEYSYDEHGNLESASDSQTGTITMEYDDRDFLARIEYPGGIWFTFEYNNAGRRTRRAGHDGYVLNYHFDDAGKLEAITDAEGGQIIQHEYDAMGRLIREDKGNGTYTTYEYDAARQIIHLVNYAPDGTEQSRFDYEYDHNGNRISVATLEGTWSYGYDATGQLTSYTDPKGQQVLYEYDLVGNRVTVTDDGVQTEYTTNNLNQYTHVGDVTYGYDGDGNMTSKTDAKGTTEYEYDIENRLISVVTPTDSTWVYTYDGLGNRITVTHNGVVTSYVHDPIGLTDVAAEYDFNGILATRYVHGLGLVVRLDSQDTCTYYGYDAMGHTRQLTDSAGKLAQTYRYDPYGALIDDTQGISQPYGFVGRFGALTLDESQVFMRARQYDLDTGRFTTPDPILRPGENLYRYSLNAPTLYFDPSGAEPIHNYFGTEAQDALEFLLDYLDDHSTAEAVNDLNPTFRWSKEPWSLKNLDERYVVSNIGPVDVDWLLTLASFGNKTRFLHPKFAYVPAKVYWIVSDLIATGSNHVPGFLGPAELNAVRMAQEIWYGASIAEVFDRYDVHAITVVASADPNEKLGPGGFGEMQFVPVGQPLPYRVSFENLPEATAPAQQVIVTDELSENLDWRTFQLEQIAFGDTVIEVPGLPGHYVGTVELDNGLIVEIEAGLDIETGVAEWTLTAIDPDTGEPPEDPTMGFLPPNDPETHSGEGYVTFLIRARSDVATGTEATNLATIIFDTNSPIVTNEIFNTIDADPPTSAVDPLPLELQKPSIPLTWSGDDPEGGSGLASFTIYASTNGGAYMPVIVSTTETSGLFTGEYGHTYAFYSSATDNAGNGEEPPDEPDAMTVVWCFDDCDDGDACTDDWCAPGKPGNGCTHTANYNPATECCDPATGNTTRIDDDNACTDDECDPPTGHVTHTPVADGTPCPNNEFCDGAEACAGGECAQGPPQCEECCDEDNGVCVSCTGACCVPDEECVPDVEEPSCVAQGGVYAGDGTQCEEKLCVPGACFTPDGGCVENLDVECEELGGEFQGPGTDCPLTIVASIPPNGAIDARQPASLYNDCVNPVGWASIDIVLSGDAVDVVAGDFTITVNPDDVIAPAISGLSIDGDTVTLTLNGIIPTAHWTIFTYVPRGTSTAVGYLPADVSGDGTSAQVDILDLIDFLNEVGDPLPIWSVDVDRSGEANPADILTVIDLLNGADCFDPWNGETLPE